MPHWSSDPEVCQLEVYADANWAACAVSRKSASGGVIMMDGACAAACSKTQQAVSPSSAEAEFCGIAHATCGVTRAEFYLEELGFAANVPRICADSTGSIGTTREDIRSKVKDLDVKFPPLRDKVAKSEIALQYVNTANNIADVMTKHVPPSVLHALLQSMMIDLVREHDDDSDDDSEWEMEI